MRFSLFNEITISLTGILIMLETSSEQGDHAHVHFVGISLEFALEGGGNLEIQRAEVLVRVAAKVGRCLKLWRRCALAVSGRWFADCCHL